VTAAAAAGKKEVADMVVAATGVSVVGSVAAADTVAVLGGAPVEVTLAEAVVGRATGAAPLVVVAGEGGKAASMVAEVGMGLVVKAVVEQAAEKEEAGMVEVAWVEVLGVAGKVAVVPVAARAQGAKPVKVVAATATAVTEGVMAAGLEEVARATAAAKKAGPEQAPRRL